MWIACKGCGKKRRVKKDAFLVGWRCRRCGISQFKKIDPDAEAPFYKESE